ncbi:hypothetical protein J2TS4_00840 [Paenibacillus sp. J2TS4]|nr:hypothetical protein J2TS4_00840 [Paenibacillus sp. J2TS4]
MGGTAARSGHRFNITREDAALKLLSNDSPTIPRGYFPLEKEVSNNEWKRRGLTESDG